MSSSPGCIKSAGQDSRPTTSIPKENYPTLFEDKLTNKMSVHNVNATLNRATSPISSACANNLVESSDAALLELYTRKSEEQIDADPLDSEYRNEDNIQPVPGIVSLDEATIENVSHISYPIAHDSSQGSFIRSVGTSVIQNVGKVSQNFALNVDANAAGIATIQSVPQAISGSTQALWLPTILTSTTPSSDMKAIDDDRPSHAVSQIIITHENYTPNSPNQCSRKTETAYMCRPKTSRVQILSNITIPKSSTFQQLPQTGKDIDSYAGTNHIYKVNANILPQKHLNNSVLSNKTSKSQSLAPSLSPTLINQPASKPVTYSQAYNKTSAMVKTLNKVNNGANLNTVAAPPGNNQGHVMPRVVTPKLAVGTGKKSANTYKATAKSSTPNSRGSRAIKIIQQAPPSKPDKNWSLANNCKTTSNINDYVNCKQSQETLHKMLPKPNNERLLLQSPCGPVLISTAQIVNSGNRPPNYVQSGQCNVRFVQSFMSDNQAATAQRTANQHLTAQILQSLSQPKLMLPPSKSNYTHMTEEMLPLQLKSINQKRIVYGDPSALLTDEELNGPEKRTGMEKRPKVAEELLRYTFENVAFVMMDHTYALSAQKQATPSTPPVSTVAAEPTSPQIVTSPLSPVKGSSPVALNMASSTELISLQSVSSTIVSTPMPVASVPGIMNSLTYMPVTNEISKQEDDDAGSVISSIDGGQHDRAGSDTETAPEGEEEGRTRCVCDYTHDDGYMICCDRCGEWQHVDCMGIDRQNIPDSYMCELCQPRIVDRRRARAIQMRKREELNALVGSDTDSSDGAVHSGAPRRKRLLTVTTYCDTSGTSVTTYNSAMPIPVPPVPPPPLQKRGPKKPKRAEVMKKITKRKMTEKRVKRKKEMILNRNKFNSNMQNQLPWHDSFESAMTNHYSPELRAKIAKYSNKLGNMPNMTSAINAHFCTTVPHAGGKILISTRDLIENTPVIELRGKYMLSTQHRPQLPTSGRAGSQKPGPFVFFYRLPKDNTQICIDTRTYGNEARFVRRSCKPNAELQHCIIKGTLHVYLVTTSVIQSNTEITVCHDSHSGKQLCACGNPKSCKMNGLASLPSRKITELTPREKRCRNRRSSSSSPSSPPSNPIPVAVKEPQKIMTIKPEKKSPFKTELCDTLSANHNACMALKFEEPKFNAFVKEEPKIENSHDEVDSIKEDIKIEMDSPTVQSEECQFETKETMKPKLEKELFDVPPEDAKISEKNEPEEIPENKHPSTPIKLETPQVKSESPVKAKEEPREVRPARVARSATHERSTRSSRTTSITNRDSIDDKTDDSQDKSISLESKDKRKMTREERKMEAIMKAFERMERAEQRKQEVKERQNKRRESDTVHPSEKDLDHDEDSHQAHKKRRKRKGRARTTSANNRRRLNSVDSDMVTSGDESVMSPCHTHNDQRRESQGSAPNHSADEDKIDPVHEDVGLSSACLLVEAAVGPLESAFKLPKTKKTMATEWVGRSPERTPSPYTSPYRPPLAALSAPSLENLVKVASTMIGDLSGHHSESDETGCTSPARNKEKIKPPKKARRVGGTQTGAAVKEEAPLSLPQHSAKKRWLRQAISEGDSPTATLESPPNEMITPLKKRRLARESLCDQTQNIPVGDVSPNLTSEDSPVKEEGRDITAHCKMKRRFMDNMYENYDHYGRDSIHSDDQSNDKFDASNDCLNVNLRAPRNSEKFDMDIRRIIGVPGTEAMSYVARAEDLSSKPIDVNDNDCTIVSEEKAPTSDTNMEIDTEITSVKSDDVTIIEEGKSDDVTIIDEKSNDVTIIEDNSPPESQRDENQNDTKQECNSEIPSAVTSSSSSPQLDEMDDIQKKIHSFHTENIQILRSRNKKLPKEKRKKVNLNFDLNMVDDQISVELRKIDNNTPEINGEIQDEHDSMGGVFGVDKVKLPPMEYIPLPPAESLDSIPLPSTVFPESIPLPDPPALESIPLPKEPLIPHKSEIFKAKEKTSKLTTRSETEKTADNPEESKKAVDNPEDTKEAVDNPGDSKKVLDNTEQTKESTQIIVSVSSVHITDDTEKSHPHDETDSIKHDNEDIVTIDQTTRKRVEPEEIENQLLHLTQDKPHEDTQTSEMTEVITVEEKPPETKQTEPELEMSNTKAAEVAIIEPVATKVHIEEASIEVPTLEPKPDASLASSELEVKLDKTSIEPLQLQGLVDESGSQKFNEELTYFSKDNRHDVSFSTLRYEKPTMLDNTNLTFSSRFGNAGRFSGMFDKPDIEVVENVPTMNEIKNAIDRTSTSMQSGLFCDTPTITPADEMKNVQEIISRVNSMDTKNSMILSGVLKSTDIASTNVPNPSLSPVKPYCARSNDPRLNPPTVDKPKPIRKKLSITEYRKRKGPGSRAGSTSRDGTATSLVGSVDETDTTRDSSDSSRASLSPLRLDAAAAAADLDLEQRVHQMLAATEPKSVFDAQPTQLERQRENLSERLRREFGLSLPEDEEARSATALHDTTEAASDSSGSMQRSGLHRLPRFDR